MEAQHQKVAETLAHVLPMQLQQNAQGPVMAGAAAPEQQHDCGGDPETGRMQDSNKPWHRKSTSGYRQG